MAAVKFLGITFVKSHAEREIQSLFEQYEEALLTQKKYMYDELTEWADALTQSIHKSMNKERHYLEKQYAARVQELRETRDQFIEDLHVREQMKNAEEIDQLVEHCKTLKYELAALETTVQTIPFLQVPYKKKSVDKSQDGVGVTRIKNAAFDNCTIGEDRSELENSMNTRSAFSSYLSFGSTTQANAQASRLSPCNDSNGADDDDPPLDLNENLEKKCPVCFMIFPRTMGRSDRTRHIQEHDTED